MKLLLTKMGGKKNSQQNKLKTKFLLPCSKQIAQPPVNQPHFSLFFYIQPHNLIITVLVEAADYTKTTSEGMGKNAGVENLYIDVEMISSCSLNAA